MTYEDAVAYINSVEWKTSRPGLERIRELMKKLGDPQKKLKFIHVAGTNGKGSVCAMLTRILMKAGYKTGTFTSPYIRHFNDRMCINGKEIENEELALITEKVRTFADSMEDHPTEFEMMTAIGLEYFYRNRCDIVILEVGMGGRLDSTNVIDVPELAVITGIALDHTAFLGDTVEKIAAEKAGIIKNGCSVIFGGKKKEALPVIAEKVKENGGELITVKEEKLSRIRCTAERTLFDYDGYTDLETGLLGLYQPQNAAVVVEAFRTLQKKGWKLTEAHLREGLKEAVWPARFEKLSEVPTVIYDGGHNPEGVDLCVESVKQIFGKQKLLVVTGVMKDKEYPYMAKRLCEIAERVYAVTPEYYRALSGEEYAKEFQRLGTPAEGFASVEAGFSKAVERAKETGVPILVTGSLYMYEEIDRIKSRYV